MGVSVLIAASLRNANTKRRTISVTRTLAEPATCELVTEDAAGAIIPDVGNIVEIQDQNSDVQFFGSAQEVTTTKLGHGSGVSCRVTATDLNHAATRRNAGQYEYVNRTVLYIVTDIVSNSLAGDLTDVSLVETGPTIPNFIIDMATVKEAFDALAELAAMRWYIDELNRLNFFTPSVTADAPFAISSGSNVHMLSIRETREDYCNSVSARAGSGLRDPETESFVGDGSKTSFELTYPVGAAPTITLDGVAVTVGIGDVDTGKDWYWNQGSKEIRQDAGGTVLTAGNTLAVTYAGVEPLIVSDSDTAEITARAAAEGNSGIYHKHLELEGYLSRADATATIAGYLARHKQMTFVLSAELKENREPAILALRPGQVLNFTLAGYGTTGLFLVKTVTLIHDLGIDDQSTYQWSCRFEAVKGPVLSNFVDLFRGPGGGGSAGGTAGTATSGAGTYVQEENLTANLTITADVKATKGASLVVFVTQDSTPRTINFDTGDFAPVTNTNIPNTAGAVTSFPFVGRSDGLWWFSGFSATNV